MPYIKKARYKLPWPPSVNHYWGHRVCGKRVIKYIGAKGKAFREAVNTTVDNNTDDTLFNPKHRLRISVNVHSPDRRRRDLDNLMKSTFDALQAAGVYEDDCLIDKFCVTRNKLDPNKKGFVIVSIGVIDEEKNKANI